MRSQSDEPPRSAPGGFASGLSETGTAVTRRRHPPRPAPPRDLVPGDVLAGGRFTVERVIGAGGMGVVHAAWDRDRAASVALKTLTWADPGAMDRMKHEFRALADVAHPNLVELHGLHLDGDRCFFTMELVTGVPLTDHLRPSGRGYLVHPEAARTQPGYLPDPSVVPGAPGDHGPPTELPEGKVVPAVVLRGDVPDVGPWHGPRRPPPPPFDERDVRDVFRQLAAGVDAIHAAGKLHRDLKPSNVLVTRDGRVVILDFGLARDQRDDDPGADLGVCGTPAYMAPEQSTRAGAGPESDWYAVGAMLYEVLTGRLPFEGDSLSILAQKRERSAVPPDRVVIHPLPADLRRLTTGLLARRPSDRLRREEALAALGVRPGSGTGPGNRAARGGDAALVGRGAELRVLGQALASVQATRRCAVTLVRGRAGMGKTTLVDAFLTKVQSRGDGVWVLPGRCYEREAIPYKGVDAVAAHLAHVLDRCPLDDRPALDPVDAAALVQLFPSLGRVFAPASQPGEGDPRALRRRAFRTLKQLLRDVAADRRVVIWLDDVQWGDVDGARLLEALLAPPDPPPLLLVISHRIEDEKSALPLAILRDALEASAGAVATFQLSVDGLARDDAHGLARAFLEDPRDDAPIPASDTPRSARALDAICREADGSPLLLAELTHFFRTGGGTEGGGVGLGDVVAARAAGLGPEARRLFDLVCVAGRPLEASVALGAAGLDARQGDEAVRQLRIARLVRTRLEGTRETLAPFHDRVRESHLPRVSEAQLVEAHGDLARALAARPTPDPERLAIHYAGAGMHAEAARQAERAGDRAVALLAFDRAAEMYRLALDSLVLEACPVTAMRALRRKLAEALSDGGRGSEAAPLFLEAAAGAPPEEALELRRRASEQWLVSGRIDRGMDILREVLGEVGLALPATPRAALRDVLWTRLKLRFRGLGFTPRAAAEIPPDVLLRIDACKASWALSFVNTILGAAFQARYLAYALDAGEPYRIALGLGFQAIFRSMEGGGAAPEVDRLKSAQRGLTETLDDKHAEAWVHLVEGQTSYLLGRWSRCTEALREAESLLVRHCRDVTWELNSSRFFWGNGLVYHGRWRELAHRVDGWIRDAEEREDLYASASLHLLRTRSVTLSAGDVQRARDEIDAALGEWVSPEFGVQRFLGALSHVQLDLYEGDGAAAVGRCRAFLPAFSRSLMTRIQLCRIHAAHHLGYAALAWAADSPGHRRRALRLAARQKRALERERMPWADAFADYLGAGLAWQAGDEEGALDGLRRAADQFDACAMRFYAAATRRRVGMLEGGEAGREGVARVDELLQAEGVARPDRLAAMMAPGIGG